MSIEDAGFPSEKTVNSGANTNSDPSDAQTGGEQDRGRSGVW